MDKIALVTCYMNNYGATLQAFAMQNKLNEINGKDSCTILQYDLHNYADVFNAYKISFRIKYLFRYLKYKCKEKIKKFLNKHGKNYEIHYLNDISSMKYYRFRKNILN